MIKKVEGYNAWVMPVSEFEQFLKARGRINMHFHIPSSMLFPICIDLPLFDTQIKWRYIKIDKNDKRLCLYIDILLQSPCLSVDFIQKVNERWNEFFDDSKNN